jgi:DNA-binding response OmpR family regulator
MNRILVVDDEQDICEILKYNLEKAGYEVDTAFSAEEALTMPIEDFSLILLDVMLGGMSGFAMAEILKKDKVSSNVPIIFITAKDTENDTVTGFCLGADDYISKPFSLAEVLSRVKAVLKRTSGTISESFCNGKLVLDERGKRITVEGNEVGLTKKEFEILLLFLRNPGKVFSRENLLSEVWSGDNDVFERVVDVNINHLRAKLGILGSRIVTRHGYGYLFDDEVR